MSEGNLHVHNLVRHDKPGVFRKRRHRVRQRHEFVLFTGSLVSLQIKSEDFSLPCQITLYMLDVKRPEHAAYTCLCVCVDKILRSGHAVDMHTRSHPSDHRAREDTAAVLVLDIPFSQRARFILLNSKILNKSLTLNHHLI